MTAFLTHGLIAATYAILAALAAGAALHVAGLSLEIAALIGAGLFLAAAQAHGMIARLVERRAIEGEVADLRRANLILSEDLEETRVSLAELAKALEQEAASRRRDRASEMEMMDGLRRRVDHAVTSMEAGDQSETPGDAAAAPAPVRAGLEVVRAAVEGNRIDLYLQPVVSLPQRKLRYYEAFSRLRDERGKVIPAAEYLPAAEEAGLMPVIDNFALFRCAQLVRSPAWSRRDRSVFCNLSGHSLRDETFLPQFLDYLKQNRHLRNVLIFEVSQGVLASAGPKEDKALQQLAELGFTFSMDQVTSLDFDLQVMRARGFRFVKISGDRLIAALGAARAAPDAAQSDLDLGPAPVDIHPDDFKELLTRYNVDLIADRLENEGQVVEVLDMNVDFGQGHIFGEPELASGARD